jgi:hypothetical protein
MEIQNFIESKRMKKIIVVMINLLSALAIASGGVDGGGGGTTPAHPGRVQDVIAAVQQAKSQLRLYFRYRQHEISFDEIMFGADGVPDRKFYVGNTNLLTVLEKMQIEVPADKPCYDANQVEVDGSMYASKPNAICISAFRIAPKLDFSQIPTETLGLIAHELSHHLGATEAEAVTVQQKVVDTYKLKGTDGIATYLHDSSQNISRFEEDIQAIGPALSTSKEQVAFILGKLISDFKTPEAQGPFYLFEKDISDQYDFLLKNLEIARIFVRTLSSTSDGSFAQWEYNDLFKGQNSVRFADTDSSGIYLSNRFKDVQIVRMKRIEDIEEILARSRRFVFEMKYYIEPFSLVSPLLPFNIKVSPNSWANFIGTYRVTETHCSHQGEDTAAVAEVQRVQIGKLNPLLDFIDYIQLDGASFGSKQYSTFQSTSREDEMLGTIQVSGTQSEAFRSFESGTGWEAKWLRRSFRMQKTQSGFELTQELTQQNWASLEQVQSSKTCTYNLVRE